MALRRPRRIFRAGALAPARSTLPLRPTVALGTIVIVLAGGAMLVSMPGAPLGELPRPSGVLHADPGQVAVVDGGTLRLGDAVVRLDGVQAPQRGKACGADGTDCGAGSARELAGLIRDRDLVCRLNGRDGQGFALAQCAAGGTDVNLAMVAAGWARAEADAPAMRQAEREARQAGRGLWGHGSY